MRGAWLAREVLRVTPCLGLAAPAAPLVLEVVLVSAGSRIAMALLVIAVLTAAPYFFLKSNGRSEYDRLRHEVEDMKAGNASIRHENDRLRERIDAFRTHPRLIERRARERLHVARPDEVIFVFDEPPVTPEASKEAAPR